MNESGFLKLVSYWQETTETAVVVKAARATLTLAGGTVVEIPLPLVRIDNSLAISPDVRSDGESSLAIDLTRWFPMRITPTVTRLPFFFPSQATAVRVARAFDADPATSWEDSDTASWEWLVAWEANNGTDLP